MNAFQDRLSSIFVGFYTWIVTVFFGAILLDAVYSNLFSETKLAFMDGATPSASIRKYIMLLMLAPIKHLIQALLFIMPKGLCSLICQEIPPLILTL